MAPGVIDQRLEAMAIWCRHLGYTLGEMPISGLLQRRMIDDMAAEGLIEITGDLVRITAKGWRLAHPSGRPCHFPWVAGYVARLAPRHVFAEPPPQFRHMPGVFMLPNRLEREPR